MNCFSGSAQHRISLSFKWVRRKGNPLFVLLPRPFRGRASYRSTQHSIWREKEPSARKVLGTWRILLVFLYTWKAAVTSLSFFSPAQKVCHIAAKETSSQPMAPPQVNQTSPSLVKPIVPEYFRLHSLAPFPTRVARYYYSFPPVPCTCFYLRCLLFE